MRVRVHPMRQKQEMPFFGSVPSPSFPGSSLPGVLLLLFLSLGAGPLLASEEAGQYWLDFGSTDSPVWEGFERVTPETAFGQSSRFGFFSSEPLYAHPLPAPDPLAEDFVAGNLWSPYQFSFVLRLPDGRYGIRLIARHVGPAKIATSSGRIAAGGQELYRSDARPETFYSEAMLYRGLARPYRLDQDAWTKFFSPQLDWKAFEVEVVRGRLHLSFDNLALFAMVVFPKADTGVVERKLERIDERRRRYFYEKVYREQSRAPDRYEPSPKESQRGFSAGVVPCWQPVWPWSRPGDLSVADEARLLVTRGEREPVTLAVAPLRDLSRFSVSVPDATSEGGVLLSSSQFDIRLVQYRETRQPGAVFVPTESYMTPVRSPISLQAGLAQRIWITLRVPEHLPEGTYHSAVILTSGQGSPRRISLEIEVLPLTLPPTSGLAVGWYYQDPGQFNYHFSRLPNSSARRAAMIERELRDMKDHGCTTFQLPDPLIRNISDHGAVEFDFSAWEDFVEAAHRVSLGREHPPQTFVVNIANRLAGRGAGEGSAAFGSAYSKAVRRLAEWSRQRNLPMVFWVVHAPQEQQKNASNRNLEQTRFLLQALKPLEEVRTTVTLMADFDGDVDYTVLLDDVDILQARPWGNSARMRTRAKVRDLPLWLYGGEADRISFGFYPWAIGAQGRWQWHYAYWSDPYDVFAEGWGVTFPSPYGPLPTPQYEHTREGTEDYRWLEVLEKRLAERPGHEAAEAARRLLDSIRREVPAHLEPTPKGGPEASPWSRKRLDAKLPQWREQVLRAIIRLEQEPEAAGKEG